MMSLTVPQEDCRRPRAAKDLVRFHVSSCKIRGGHSGTGTVFPRSSSVFYPNIMF